jgi:ABC-type dipeptide/oligopeptide/nickel transport system permease subunit
MLQKGLTRLQDAPWLVWFPGFLIAATVLAFNFAGDGVRDALDPKTIK